MERELRARREASLSRGQVAAGGGQALRAQQGAGAGWTLGMAQTEVQQQQGTKQPEQAHPSGTPAHSGGS